MADQAFFPRKFHPGCGLGAASRAILTGITVLLLLGAGCARDKFSYGVSERFSMNVTRPPAWFSSPKAPFSAAEKEVLARKGKPDFIRLWWYEDGRLITSSDFAGRRDEFPELLKAVKKSWLYVKGDEGEEVVFVRDGQSYQTHPLSDAIRLLCTYGDPSNKVTPVTIDGQAHETWMWIEHGIQVELIDGHVKGTQKFQGTGAGTILVK